MFYIGTRKRCGGCAQKAQCTSSPLKYLAIHMHEPARQRARDLVNISAFVDAQHTALRDFSSGCLSWISSPRIPEQDTETIEGI